MLSWRTSSVVKLAVAALVAGASPWAIAQQNAAAKAPRTSTVTPAKAHVKGPPRGPVEKFDCKVGNEDQHARIAVLAQGGEVQSVAYYSKWKPRTCSIHLQRGDSYSKWNDTGTTTTVNTEYGDFLIQVNKGDYHFIFREVDRMHYCGMMGKLNGSMTVTRGAKRTCTVDGIMERSEIELMKEKSAAGPTEPVQGKPHATD